MLACVELYTNNIKGSSVLNRYTVLMLYRFTRCTVWPLTCQFTAFNIMCIFIYHFQKPHLAFYTRDEKTRKRRFSLHEYNDRIVEELMPYNILVYCLHSKNKAEKNT